MKLKNDIAMTFALSSIQRLLKKLKHQAATKQKHPLHFDDYESAWAEKIKQIVFSSYLRLHSALAGVSKGNDPSFFLQ